MSATVTAPIRETRINQILYAGEAGIRTLQAAVDFARADGGKFTIVIQPGYPGSENISSIVNGTGNISLADRRDPAAPQNYEWDSEYIPAPFQQAADIMSEAALISTGNPLEAPAGSVMLMFDPSGSGGSGSANLHVTGIQDESFPTFNLQMIEADGSNFRTFIRCDQDTFGLPRITFPENTDITGDLAISGNIAATNLHVQGLEATNATIDNSLTVNGGMEVVGPMAAMGNALVNGILTLAHYPLQPLEAATKEYVDDAIAESGNFVYPSAGVTVSTGTAWAASIDPTSIPLLDASGNLSINGSGIFNVSGGAANTTRIGHVNATGPSFYSVSGNAVIDTPAGLYLNWSQGAGGTHFGSGTSEEVAYIDQAGNLLLNGTLSVGAAATFAGAVIATGTQAPLDVSKSAARIGAGYQSTHPNLTLINASATANNRAWTFSVFPDSGQGENLSFAAEDDAGNATYWMAVWRNGVNATRMEIRPPLTLDGNLTANGQVNVTLNTPDQLRLINPTANSYSVFRMQTDSRSWQIGAGGSGTGDNYQNAWYLYDEKAAKGWLTIHGDTGQTILSGPLTATAGLAVSGDLFASGNLTVTGTMTGGTLKVNAPSTVTGMLIDAQINNGGTLFGVTIGGAVYSNAVYTGDVSVAGITGNGTLTVNGPGNHVINSSGGSIAFLTQAWRTLLSLHYDNTTPQPWGLQICHELTGAGTTDFVAVNTSGNTFGWYHANSDTGVLTSPALMTLDGAGNLTVGGNVHSSAKRMPDGTDMNTSTATGFYDCNTPVNPPAPLAGISTMWWNWVAADPNFLTQMATDVAEWGTPATLFFRHYRAGAWTPWLQVNTTQVGP